MILIILKGHFSSYRFPIYQQAKNQKQSVILIFVFLFYFEQSGFKPWLGTLYCAFRQDTLLPQSLSSLGCVDRYWRI